MKVTFRNVAIAAATLACAGMLSATLSVDKAEAKARVYIRTGYAASSNYYTNVGLPWYAVRAYYFGGPWSGPGWSWASWKAYADANGIGCVPGTGVKGGDGIMYRCQ